ncbi:MAG: hypothetical protein A2928_03885 [Candidatus Taylorbacteria bacterium RIFCSPLOWO2_01_FULL_45_15b]|uniref:Glycosyl transferase family 1 domain-containing protein n=1 Tax=Candidatus Taylorbacteria bacterium RIFCSPLOWO2_01_FULL_45_15b TaxID=1802319 RepID=A0A1G2NEY7_9BACT|nr:MAG: hypothetical protein A2928_03885 [Candidatus Taylorbacteria bacterium RIFCSPLOWO2_01_FULL_45_15b]
MKKILIFSTDYLPHIGGAEIAASHVAANLQDDALCVLITSRMSASLPRKEKIGAVRVHRIGIGIRFDKFLLPFFGLIEAWRLQREESFDAVWVMMASQASVAAAFFSFIFPHVPVVLTLQEGDEEEHLHRYVLGNRYLYRLLIRPWYRFIFHRAKRITAISRYLLERARRIVPEKELFLVPNGVDDVFFQRVISKKTSSQKTILSVSRLVKKNGLDILIRALVKLPSEFFLVIAGEGGEKKSLQDLTRSLSLDARVAFLGAVPNADLPALYQKADVFSRPSRSEGLGISFLEAIVSGVPVVAPLVGGIRDFLIDRRTGIVHASDDPDDLVRAIREAVEDDSLRACIIENSRNIAENYRWKKISEEMRKIFFSN